MFDFRVQKISPSIHHIVDASETSMFLVVGEKKALLIDTGIGIVGLNDFIKTITPLPLTVILTHGHLDHSGGSSQFTSVYVHPQDVPLIFEGAKEARCTYTRNLYNFIHNMNKASDEPDVNITDEEIMPYLSDTATTALETLPLSDGMIFDLGGVSIEIIEVPGHTRGSCCMLFREERAILFGDACNPNTLVYFEHSTSIEEYRKSLLRLKSYGDRFDTVYLSHGGPAIDKILLDNNIELCDEILSHTDDHVEEMGMDGKICYRAKKVNGWLRVDGKEGNIVYR